jgi:hypothetical protein
MNEILERALKSLSVTCNKSMLHTSDEDRIKVTFRVLYKKGINLNANEIEEWLVAENWQSNPIKIVVKWAQAIDSGGRVQLKFKNMAPSEKEIWARLNA